VRTLYWQDFVAFDATKMANKFSGKMNLRLDSGWK